MKIEDITNVEHRRRLFWLFQFLFWSAHSAVYLFNHPKIFSHIQNISAHVLSIFAAFALSMGLRHIYRKYHCHHLPPGVMISIILLYSMICGLTNGFADRLIGYFNFGDEAYPLHFLTVSGIVNLLWRYAYTFVAWSALYIGFKIYEEWMVEKEKASRAQALAQSAQLAMLRYQLNPHFFFNSLSSLLSLISRDPKKAEQVLIKISEFMRYSLLSEDQQVVPLSQETEIVRHYLDIEKVRYGRKLSVSIAIDREAEGCPIPILILHSLVDNAVKHGMETTKLPLRIHIRGRMADSTLTLEVENTGSWIESQHEVRGKGQGTGLENTRRRLEHFYPGNHSLEVLKEGGTVCVKIILRHHPHEETLQDIDRRG